MSSEFIYTEQRKIVWVLIIVPLFWSAIFISAILSIQVIPDWLILVSSVLLILIPLLNVLYIINKWLKIKCRVEITDTYFQISLSKKGPFYRHSEVRVSWEQFKNFEVSDSRFSPYVVISLLSPSMKFCLSPISVLEKDLNSFRHFTTEIQEKISLYNESAAEKHLHIITGKSIFESTGARIGALVFAFLLIAFTLIYIMTEKAWHNYQWWRIIWLWVISSPYLIVVFGSWRRSNQ